MNLQSCRGDWALVTGASAGIGAEFCRHLAARGLNLVMVARREALLDELARELIAAHGIRTLVVPLDLAQPRSAEALIAITSGAGVKLRLLVNNAGFGPWGSFEKTSASQCEEVVQLVATTPIALCRLYLDDLASFATAAVINVSSPAALQPVPYMAVYAAAKACVHQFSLALYGEWQGRSIRVQTFLPGPTASEFDAKGGAYASGLGQARQAPADAVTASLAGLASELPIVSTQKGIYKQRVFAGVAPVKMVIREVKRMFLPPPGR